MADAADAERDAVRPIADAEPRKLVTVQGRVVSVTVAPADEAPEMVVRIDDGTGALDAVFMGRRALAGLAPGGHLRVHGRVAEHAQGPRIFNPRYELMAE